MCRIGFRVFCSNSISQSKSMDYLKKLPAHLAVLGDVSKGEIEILKSSDDEKEFGIVYEDQYLFAVRDKVKFPDGRIGGYFRIISKGEVNGSCGTVMIPKIGDSVIFIRLFRHATRAWEWELPRGYQELGVSIEDNARKEMKEELGLDVESIEELGKIKSNTGISSGEATAYLVDIPEDQLDSIVLSKDEAISEFRIVTKNRLDQFLIRNVKCGFSLSAILFAKLRNMI